MYKPLDRVQPAFIGSALAVAFSLALGVGSIPAAAAQSQAQAACADPRGAAFCTQAPRLVCCANPLPAPQIKVTPAAARPGETVVVEGSMLPRVDGSASVLFEWWSQDGALIDGDTTTLAAGSVGQLELVVPHVTPGEGTLCVHRLGFQTACTAFTILPETTPADLNRENDPDNSSW